MARSKDMASDTAEIDRPAPVEETPPKAPSLIWASGRGNNGKSTGLRFLAEEALLGNRPVIIADCDRTNQTLTAFFGDVTERPDHPDDHSVHERLNQIINQMVADSTSAILDMGGGDLVFPAYAASIDLVDMLMGANVRPAALHFLSPAVDDLSTLQDVEEAGAFCPPATALILNAGLIRDTRSIDVAFRQVREHPVYKAALARGAVEIIMPRLSCMQDLDRQRMMFYAAESGRVSEGQTALGFTQAHMVKIWRRQMRTAFSPIQDWLP